MLWHVGPVAVVGSSSRATQCVERIAVIKPGCDEGMGNHSEMVLLKEGMLLKLVNKHSWPLKHPEATPDPGGLQNYEQKS